MGYFLLHFQVIYGQYYGGADMANKEQKSNSNTKKEPKLNLKEKRLVKQEKKSKKD